MVKNLLTFLSSALFLLYLSPIDLKAAVPEAGQQRPTGKILYYHCDDGSNFTVELPATEDAALLTVDGTTQKLPRLVSGSGVRFGDGRTTLWLKGDEAFVEVDGRMIRKNCQIRE